MRYEPFSRIALRVDVPDHGLRRGDVATIVDRHPGPAGREPAYSVEVFNAVGETLAVLTLPGGQIEPLTRHEVLQVRELASPSS